MLRHLYFYDRNESHDRWNNSRDLDAVKSSEVFTEMGGRMETFSNQYYCAHLVMFGSYERREDQTPIAAQTGAKRLKSSGEE